MAVDRADFYDAELRRHHQHFRAAMDVGLHDRVLDIGCGAGQSTRDAARAAKMGSALGVDVSQEMLEVARQRCAEAGLGNVAFELGDAQVHGFPAACFDLCISRFGTMFFAHPTIAFANVGRAMRPDGRLVLMVWQPFACNEWALAIQHALTPAGFSSGDDSPAFSLGDPRVTECVLTAAGFASVDFTEVHEPVFYGSDVDAAHEAVIDVFLTEDQRAAMAPFADKPLPQLHHLLEAHSTDEGVLFDSRAWIVTAHWAGYR
ncbi:methyltransferase domain-containing protein [uncultured Nitratireductor sp.]|uniref:class I SAM-dependent methyltransferase n=1 Tax=uncultured Nitratireductor sp. TaxID=520953 RepID=UPI0025EC8999|nr:methyltransferase domain-containing protein [uncultured Nitratireductor sp.]